MLKQRVFALGCAGFVILCGGLWAAAQNKATVHEQEREVKEAEVPKPALVALKKLADKAAITEFAEEMEHGHKFYEGSWAGVTGNVDALVTESGDLVEIEEVVAAENLPAAVRAESEKQAGKGTKVTFEKKTLILYEMHFTKDGKGHEAVFTPDGRAYHEEEEKKGDKEAKNNGD